MYAIFETGGKQYRVEQGDIIDVELLKQTDSGKISFDHVLFMSHEGKINVGTPYLSGAKVAAEVMKEVKGEKVVAYKYKKRKGFHKKKGHRQKYLRVKITEITG